MTSGDNVGKASTHRSARASGGKDQIHGSGSRWTWSLFPPLSLLIRTKAQERSPLFELQVQEGNLYPVPQNWWIFAALRLKVSLSALLSTLIIAQSHFQMPNPEDLETSLPPSSPLTQFSRASWIWKGECCLPWGGVWAELLSQPRCHGCSGSDRTR